MVETAAQMVKVIAQAVRLCRLFRHVLRARSRYSLRSTTQTHASAETSMGAPRKPGGSISRT